MTYSSKSECWENICTYVYIYIYICNCSLFSLQVKCTFTKVFADDVGQSEVFNNIGLPLMEDLLGGRNG